MKFIKRLLVIAVLLVVSFFVYRLISPSGAKALLYDLKSFSNSTLGTNFLLTGTVDISVSTTGTILDATGILIEDTGGLQELSGDDELLFNDQSFLDEPSASGTVSSGAVSGTVVIPSSTGTVPPPKKPTTPSTSSNNGISAKDIADLQTLFGN